MELRGEDAYTPHESLALEEGASLLPGAVSAGGFECHIEEACLETGQGRIGSRIKDPDIFRTVFIVMVKR